MMQPLVSVVMITYGHENYISDAIKGVLMQKTDFPVEFVIANDRSPDNSDNLIKDLVQNAPENISVKYHLHEKNMGMMPNFIWAIDQSKGKYIAMCEGDDYWTDSLKLQRQVEALDKNPDVDICGHPSLWLEKNEFIDKNYGFWGMEEKIIAPSSLIENFITCGLQSIMIRNKNVDIYRAICDAPALGGHSSIQLLYGLSGGLYYLPEYMAVYRSQSSSSISKTLFKNDHNYIKRQLGNLVALDRLNKVYRYKYNREILKLKRKRIYHMLNNKKVSFRQFLQISFKYNMFSDFQKHYSFMKENYFR